MPEIEESTMISILGRFSCQGNVIIRGMENKVMNSNDKEINAEQNSNERETSSVNAFPSKIEEVIVTGRAIAAVDASAKWDFIAAT